MDSTTSVTNVTTENVAPSKIGSSRRNIGQDSRSVVRSGGEGGVSTLDGDDFGTRTQSGFNNSYVSYMHLFVLI